MSKVWRIVCLSCVIAALAATGCGSKKGSLACKSSAPRPQLQGSSNDAVLLRYKFTAGEKIGMDMSVGMHMNIKAPDMSGDADVKMVMGMEMEFTDVSGDTVTGTTAFTKMTMDMNMPGGAGSVHWNSDEAGGNPALDSLKAMIGPRMPIKMTTRGELISLDWGPVKAAMEQAGAPASMTDQLTNDDSLKSALVMLPEKPVKVGDEWDGGEMKKDMNGMMSMNVKYKYKLVALSADKKKAILEGTPDLDIKGGGMLDIKSQKLGSDAWIEYDVDSGNIDDANIKLCMELGAEAQGEHADMTMDMDAQYKETRLH